MKKTHLATEGLYLKISRIIHINCGNGRILAKWNKLQWTGGLDFIFYDVIFNPILQISDQSSKVKVCHTETTPTFSTNLKNW